MCNAHPYFSLKKLGKKVFIIHGKVQCSILLLWGEKNFPLPLKVVSVDLINLQETEKIAIFHYIHTWGTPHTWKSQRLHIQERCKDQRGMWGICDIRSLGGAKATGGTRRGGRSLQDDKKGMCLVSISLTWSRVHNITEWTSPHFCLCGRTALFGIYLLIKTSSLFLEDFRTSFNYISCDLICYKYEILKAY